MLSTTRPSSPQACPRNHVGLDGVEALPLLLVDPGKAVPMLVAGDVGLEPRGARTQLEGKDLERTAILLSLVLDWK